MQGGGKGPVPTLFSKSYRGGERGAPPRCFPNSNILIFFWMEGWMDGRMEGWMDG